MGLIWLSPKNIIYYCPGCSKSVAFVGSVKNLLSCLGTHSNSKGLNAMIYSTRCNNDGAKRNRELYLKIMYTWVKKILPLPKFWPFLFSFGSVVGNLQFITPFFSNQHDSWLYPLFCPSFCLFYHPSWFMTIPPILSKFFACWLEIFITWLWFEQ